VDTVGDGKADHYYDSTEGRLVAITEVSKIKIKTELLTFIRVALSWA